MRMNRSFALMVVMTVSLTAGSAWGRSARPGVTDADVDDVIDKMVQWILASQVKTWGLGYMETPPPWGRGARPKFIQGKLLRETRSGVVFRTTDGKTLNVPANQVKRLFEPGHFTAEYGYWTYPCGPSALMTLALLVAGLSDDRPEIQLALKFLGNDPKRWPKGRRLAHTYCTALRAAVWSHLAIHTRDLARRERYRRLLRLDAQWLAEAIHESGWYTYSGQSRPDRWRPKPGTRTRGGDHSNTQVGVLGMWAAANAHIELPGWYWLLVERHWMRNQFRNGGWAYSGTEASGAQPRATMTTAGLNCMYIVLDKLHAVKQGGYVRFAGIKPNPKVQAEIARVFEAIDRGLKWMEKHDRGGRSGYYLYGLERLGVASGLKYIGRDWYRHGANYVVPRYRRLVVGQKGPGPYDAMVLMFLCYGRAPVLFNKLAYGPQEKWNYYFRDLHHLCRYISRMSERIYKWQIVDLDASMHDWRDAPMLYIAGREPFKLPDEQLAKLRTFCDYGGTIVAHADLRSKAFADSFKQTMVKLYEDRGYEFRTLPKDHPIYRTHFGQDATPWRVQIPIQGMSDGVRDFVLLFPVDIAGAWHQNRLKSEADLFRIMFNLRMYAAAGWSDLPGRLRPPELAGTPKTLKYTLRIARIKHRGGCDVIPAAWKIMAKRLAHYHGLGLEELPPVELTKPNDPAQVDVLHLTGFGKFKFDQVQLAVLNAYLAGGGFFWADAVAGRKAFDESMRELMLKLSNRPAGRLLPSHPILAGGAGPLRKVQRTRWAKTRFGGRRLPLYALRRDGKLVLLYSPMDVTAAMAGHYVWGSAGYLTPTARQLITNVLLWRAEQKAKAQSSSTK